MRTPEQVITETLIACDGERYGDTPNREWYYEPRASAVVSALAAEGHYFWHHVTPEEEAENTILSEGLPG